jgi:hypothetical protein
MVLVSGVVPAAVPRRTNILQRPILVTLGDTAHWEAGRNNREHVGLDVDRMLAEHILPAGTAAIDLSEPWVVSRGKERGGSFPARRGPHLLCQTTPHTELYQQPHGEIL